MRASSPLISQVASQTRSVAAAISFHTSEPFLATGGAFSWDAPPNVSASLNILHSEEERDSLTGLLFNCGRL